MTMISKNQWHNFNVLSFLSVMTVIYISNKNIVPTGCMLNSLENNDLFDASTRRLTLKEDETLLPKNSHPKKKQAISHSK